MKSLFIVLIIFSTCLACSAQAVGRVYFGEDAMEVPSGTPDHLEFEASKSDLSDNSKAYLQSMLDQYGTIIKRKTGAKLIIEPASSGQKEESDKVAMKRIEAIEKFLKKTSVKPDKTNFRNQVITIHLASRLEKA